ncbi:MAG: PfkB family carbohydrate kinase [Bacteroidota bacterium]
MITTFGEIMLRLTPRDSGKRIIQTNDFRAEPGGSESNVAIALASLGINSQFVTRLPENQLTHKIQRYFDAHKVKQQFVMGGERVGIYWTETGVGPRNSFVIYDRDHSSFSEAAFDEFNWDEILKNTTWFHFSGISPAVSKSVADLLQKVIDQIKIPYSVDLNYRKKLWNWVNKDKEQINQIMTKLCSKATLIAGNESDFSDIFGIDSEETGEDKKYKSIAKQVFQKFPDTKYISFSNRISLSATRNDWNGFLFVSDKQQVKSFKGVTYSIDHIIDRIGTGDSFVAGIIHGLNSFNQDYQKTVDFAVTLAALNHTTRGDASSFSEEEVLNAMKTKGSGRIVR